MVRHKDYKLVKPFNQWAFLMEEIKPINKTSFVEQIATNLRRQILSGALKPGEKLPPEREMAQQFGTNRNTLREAIRYLEGLKLISVRQGDGIRVRDFRFEADAGIIPFFLVESTETQERLSVMRDFLIIRKHLLAEAASLAAERRGAEELDEFERVIGRIENAGSEQEIAELDLKFYQALIKSSKSLTSNWMFNTFLDVYLQAMPLIMAMWVTPPNYLDSLRALVDSIRSRDSKRAAEIVGEHLGGGDEIILGNIEQDI